MTGNILEDINAYIENNLSLYSTPIYLEIFPGVTADEIMTRSDPGAFQETSYMDGARTGEFSFSVYCKSDSLEGARDQLANILELLYIPDMIPLTEVCSIMCIPNSNPIFVKKTDKNEFIYTASLGLEYYKEG